MEGDSTLVQCSDTVFLCLTVVMGCAFGVKQCEESLFSPLGALRAFI